MKKYCINCINKVLWFSLQYMLLCYKLKLKFTNVFDFVKLLILNAYKTIGTFFKTFKMLNSCA